MPAKRGISELRADEHDTRANGTRRQGRHRHRRRAAISAAPSRASLAAAGASVVVNARSNQAEADAVVREIEAAGGKAIAVLADVADPAAVEAMAQAALKAFGRIDILVNNASLRREKPIERDELCRVARGDGRHARLGVSRRARLPAGDEESRRRQPSSISAA